jgi:glycosyltransferase involved in cell wall biosynthesis
MKILMLTPYLPYPLLSGGQIRTFNLLKQLSSKHEITLFALIKDNNEQQHINDIAPYCHKIRVFKRSKLPFTVKNIAKTAFTSYPFLVMRNHVPRAITAIKAELDQHSYDLIHAETFYMMPHIPTTRAPVLLVEQTIEYLGYQSFAIKKKQPLRWLLNADIKKIIHWEQHYWQQADSLVTMSQDDRQYVQQFISNPAKVRVVSNGVDSSWFSQIKTKLPSQPTIIYVGTFKWLPNVEAVTYLVEKVWPYLTALIPNVQLKIVGNAPTAKIKSYTQLDPRITVLDRVEDIRDAFTQAHLLLAPVFSGKGTRYKILEAMACGTPIVASSIAVEGLNLTHKKQVLIADQPDKMAQYALELISNPKLWAQLSQEGKRFVRINYDWQIISKKLDQIYQSMGNQ